MGKYDNVYENVVNLQSLQNIRFDDLCNLLNRLGFDCRQKGGSHKKFFKTGVVEILTLQPGSSGKAKPYQVRQVSDVIKKYNLKL